MSIPRPSQPKRRYREPDWELLSREDLRARQFSLVKERLRELAATHPYYRKLWRSADLDVEKIRDFGDFARMVPMMTKQDVLADQADAPPFGTLLGVERRRLAMVHLTSGTSGIGQGAFGLTADDVELAGRSYAHLWHHAGLDAGDVGVMTYPVSFLTAGLIAVPASRQLGLVPVYGFGVDKRILVRVMATLGAAMLFGTPGVLRDLHRVAEEEGIVPGRDIRLKALCTGLTGPPWVETIESVQEAWRAPVFENYGSTEAGMAAAVSCEYGVWDGTRRFPLHFLDSLVYCEVIDHRTGLPVADGEEGEVVITTFRRQASTVVRYRTGDRVVHVPHSACPCGRPFDGIVPGEIQRYDDMVKIKGATLWPATVDGIVFSHAEIDEYRVTLRSDERGREELLLAVALDKRVALEPTEKAALLDRIRDQIKVATMVTPRVVEVAELPHFDFKAKRWVDERHGAESPPLARQGEKAVP